MAEGTRAHGCCLQGLCHAPGRSCDTPTVHFLNAPFSTPLDADGNARLEQNRLQTYPPTCPPTCPPSSPSNICVSSVTISRYIAPHRLSPKPWARGQVWSLGGKFGGNFFRTLPPYSKPLTWENMYWGVSGACFCKEMALKDPRQAQQDQRKVTLLYNGSIAKNLPPLPPPL